jgi:hypothetical protein
MSRSCRTCQHLRRPEIDRRLAAGEPLAGIARDFELNPSSLHRHRVNCLKLGPAHHIKRDAARGTAALALLPSKENLGDAYGELIGRIDQIIEQAQRDGSLKTALSGLNSIRQTLDSLVRLGGHLRGPAPDNQASQAKTDAEVASIAERLINAFDQEPHMKERIAAALLAMDEQPEAAHGETSPTCQTCPAAPPLPSWPAAHVDAAIDQRSRQQPQP